jgi:hypothetical protein
MDIFSLIVVKGVPKPDELSDGNISLYQDNYIFETEKDKFANKLPRDGDIIQVKKNKYRVTSTQDKPAWWDVGVSGLTIKINTVLLR